MEAARLSINISSWSFYWRSSGWCLIAQVIRWFYYQNAAAEMGVRLLPFCLFPIVLLPFFDTSDQPKRKSSRVFFQAEPCNDQDFLAVRI
ncbi:unnamed protein product [Victoria cruziana]